MGSRAVRRASGLRASGRRAHGLRVNARHARGRLASVHPRAKRHGWCGAWNSAAAQAPAAHVPCLVCTGTTFKGPAGEGPARMETTGHGGTGRGSLPGDSDSRPACPVHKYA